MHGNKKFNKYDLSGEYGVGYTNKGEKFYFDLEDYDKIKYYCWHIGGGGRVVARKENNKTPLKLHRLIMDFPDVKYDIDHIDRNQLNNRKENLRVCLHSRNIQNSKIQKNNTSGYTGVHFRKDTRRFTSQIEVFGKVLRLGCYATIEEALIERLMAEKKYFGEFAPQRHLFEKYNIQ